MTFLWLILWISSIGIASSSFINPYPRFKPHHVHEDVGEPLFLTPFIVGQNIEAGREAAKVKHDQIAFDSYSGYFTVNAEYNSNLFFWYFPAKLDPNAPVVLWLQGGPGASSLFGLFTENGPFSVSSDLKLIPREFSWHLNHHLIYIDNPVGTGFSFTDKLDGYSRNEAQVGQNLYEALLQFFTLFPNLQNNNLFVAGESYAGKYVPSVCYTIHKMNPKANLRLNLKGIAIGNGLSDPLNQLKYGDYLYQIGLIDIHGRDVFHKYEKNVSDFIVKKDYLQAFETFNELINIETLPAGSVFKNMSGYDNHFNFLQPNNDDSDKVMGDFLQLAETRRAIHVGNKTFNDLEGENKVEKYLKEDIMKSVAPYMTTLLSNYRTLIYNGQLDIIVAYPLTLNYLQQLKFPDAETYKNAPRYIWRVDGEIAGYAKESGKLVEVLVRNAGHMVPRDQPKWALDMLMRLTHSKSFH